MEKNSLYKLGLYVALIASATALIITEHYVGATFMCFSIMAVK
jgi:hypothetical protein